SFLSSAYTHHDVKRTGYVGGGKLCVLQPASGDAGSDAVLRRGNAAARNSSHARVNPGVIASQGQLEHGGVKRLAGNGPHHTGAESPAVAAGRIREGCRRRSRQSGGTH